MCSLRIGGNHQCGASIISEHWVATAAHCVHGLNATSLLLRCGTLLREKPGVDFKVNNVISHNKYNETNTDYDIALLNVADKIKLGTSLVNKIALPPQDTDFAPVGALATATGWGLNASDVLPETLQTVDLPVLDRDTCYKDYSHGHISDYMFCAGYDEGKRDSCSADSGGPLKYNNTLIGIVSWGSGCALPHYPGVYTRVGKFRNWIKEHSNV